MPEVAKSLGFDSSASARLSAAATLSVCISKLTMGSVIDCVGGRRGALFSLLAVVLATALLGTALAQKRSVSFADVTCGAGEERGFESLERKEEGEKLKFCLLVLKAWELNSSVFAAGPQE